MCYIEMVKRGMGVREHCLNQQHIMILHMLHAIPNAPTSYQGYPDQIVAALLFHYLSFHPQLLMKTQLFVFQFNCIFSTTNKCGKFIQPRTNCTVFHCFLYIPEKKS